MNDVAPAQDNSLAELDRLASIAADMVRRCRAQGASEADAVATIERGLAVNVRLGDVETVEHTRDRGIAVTVLFGKRKGSASTADLAPASIDKTIEQACAIARHTEPDAAHGLPDAALLARDAPDLDLWHPWPITAPEAIALALEIENAGRGADARIGNSEGASVQSGETLTAYANSLDFTGTERSTRHSLSCSLIAGHGDGMQRDYWYDVVRRAGDFTPAATVGTRAAERAVARLGAQSLTTRECPVLFAPETARTLVGHFLSAVSGGALYRRASFLLARLGTAVFPAHVEITERPHIPRGHGSSAFDAEGVATRDSDLVRGGVLSRYILGSYSARRLGMTTTGNAGGVHNIVVRSGPDGFEDLLRRMERGLVVTELMGQGVSLVTGDYSRGASGFWVEDGAIAFPVEEITIAGNLRDLFNGIVAIGADVDPRSHVLTGSILLERMTVAGEA